MAPPFQSLCYFCRVNANKPGKSHICHTTLKLHGWESRSSTLGAHRQGALGLSSSPTLGNLYLFLKQSCRQEKRCTILGDDSQGRLETAAAGLRCWHFSSSGAPGFRRSLHLHKVVFLKLFKAYGCSEMKIPLGFSFLVWFVHHQSF